MTYKEKKSKIADILMDFQEEYSNDVINRPMLASLYAGNILSFIDSMQKEPVSEDLKKAAEKYAFTMSGEDEVFKYDAFIEGAQWQKEQIIVNTADATIGLPYENKNGGYTHLIDVSRPLPVGNNKIAIIFKED